MGRVVRSTADDEAFLASVTSLSVLSSDLDWFELRLFEAGKLAVVVQVDGDKEIWHPPLGNSTAQVAALFRRLGDAARRVSGGAVAAVGDLSWEMAKGKHEDALAACKALAGGVADRPEEVARG